MKNLNTRALNSNIDIYFIWCLSTVGMGQYPKKKKKNEHGDQFLVTTHLR